MGVTTESLVADCRPAAPPDGGPEPITPATRWIVLVVAPLRALDRVRATPILSCDTGAR